MTDVLNQFISNLLRNTHTKKEPEDGVEIQKHVAHITA